VDKINACVCGSRDVELSEKIQLPDMTKVVFISCNKCPKVGEPFFLDNSLMDTSDMAFSEFNELKNNAILCWNDEHCHN